MAKKLTNEEFIDKLKRMFLNYDISKVEYINMHTNIILTCYEHGEFQIRPDHLLEGQGCPECGKQKSKMSRSLTKQQFINKAKKILGENYDFRQVFYTNNKAPVVIICKKHGPFQALPMNVLAWKCKCPKCN